MANTLGHLSITGINQLPVAIRKRSTAEDELKREHFHQNIVGRIYRVGPIITEDKGSHREVRLADGPTKNNRITAVVWGDVSELKQIHPGVDPLLLVCDGYVLAHPISIPGREIWRHLFYVSRKGSWQLFDAENPEVVGLTQDQVPQPKEGERWPLARASVITIEYDNNGVKEELMRSTLTDYRDGCYSAAQCFARVDTVQEYPGSSPDKGVQHVYVSDDTRMCVPIHLFHDQRLSDVKPGDMVLFQHVSAHEGGLYLAKKKGWIKPLGKDQYLQEAQKYQLPKTLAEQRTITPQEFFRLPLKELDERVNLRGEISAMKVPFTTDDNKTGQAIFLKDKAGDQSVQVTFWDEEQRSLVADLDLGDLLTIVAAKVKTRVGDRITFRQLTVAGYSQILRNGSPMTAAPIVASPEASAEEPVDDIAALKKKLQGFHKIEEGVIDQLIAKEAASSNISPVEAAKKLLTEAEALQPTEEATPSLSDTAQRIEEILTRAGAGNGIDGKILKEQVNATDEEFTVAITELVQQGKIGNWENGWEIMDNAQ
jgi:hypothetical protein